MEFRIDIVEDRVGTRAAAHVLGGLTLFREALAIRGDPDIRQFILRIDTGLGQRQSRHIERQIADAGDVFLRGQLPVLTSDDLLLIDAIMTTSPGTNDLAIESLSAGSVTGVLRDLIGSIADRFAEAVKASVRLLPTYTEASLSSFWSLLPDEPLPQRFAAGVLGFGARQLRTGYSLLQATNVIVRDDDRAGGFGGNASPIFGGPFTRPRTEPPRAQV